MGPMSQKCNIGPSENDIKRSRFPIEWPKKNRENIILFIGVHVNNLDCKYLKILGFVEVLDIFVQENVLWIDLK